MIGVIAIEGLDQSCDTEAYYVEPRVLCDVLTEDPIVSRTRAEIGAVALPTGEEVLGDRNFDRVGYSLCDLKGILAGSKLLIVEETDDGSARTDDSGDSCIFAAAIIQRLGMRLLHAEDDAVIISEKIDCCGSFGMMDPSA